MSWLLRILRFVLSTLFTLFVVGVLATAAVYAYVAPDLPAIEVLKDVRLQVPLRVYTRDGLLMAEFGEKRRTPVKIAEVPELMVKAVLAAEDDRFYEHPGVDYQGILRAAFHLIRTGEKGQGGSTITMQVARNFFLSREKTYLRKISEIFLALKIERELSKAEVLELYLNKIYLGQRTYGVGAAAQVYYGLPLDQLDVAQVAMIAGLPKAPSRLNPIANPDAAVTRRDYVLRRMHELDFIDDTVYESARNAPVTARLHGLAAEVEAPYLAEMVRAEMVRRLDDDAYTAGYRVYTTVDGRLQKAANAALRSALQEYDTRHGYRGPDGHIELSGAGDPDSWQRQLGELPVVAGLQPGVVLAVNDQTAVVFLADSSQVRVEWEGLKWARRYKDENRRGPQPKKAADIVQPGDVVRLAPLADNKWRLAQVPAVEGALVSLAPETGAIQALIGGFDFFQSKFNRVTQAQRQPGSAFKPFIYSAALEQGFTAASLINDAPVVFEDAGLESAWRPENYSGRFYGPTRLRVALTHSRNLVSIRLLREIGIRYAIDYVSRFGFDVERLPNSLSLALGSGTVTPLELVRAYAVFANGGYLIEPYFIARIEDADGQIAFETKPATVCRECEQGAHAVMTDAANSEAQPPSAAERVITPQNHHLITSLLGDVVRYGTGRRALQLGRRDVAGKTGTTNDQRDAWFAGFTTQVVAVAWVGFDSNDPLGNRETGGRAALPMWMAFMGEALKGLPEKAWPQPPGLVTVRIDPETGQLASADQKDAIFETFRAEYVPQQVARSRPSPASGDAGNTSQGIPEQLF